MKGGMGGQAVALAHGAAATCSAALRHAIPSCWAAQVVLARCDIVAVGEGPDRAGIGAGLVCAAVAGASARACRCDPRHQQRHPVRDEQPTRVMDQKPDG